MEFGKLYNIFFYILIPLAALIFFLGHNKKNKILKQINLTKYQRPVLIQKILQLMGIFFMIFALLEPKILKGTMTVERRGLEIYFVIDVSKSMLTEDIKPTRLDRAKESIKQIINVLQGDRVGFIPFSSDAYIQMPLTEDYDVALLFLDSVDTDMISGGGTNIAKAIELASISFVPSTNSDKVMVLFSDGEEHNSEAIAMAEKIQNVKIFTVGVGSPKGELIPEYNSEGNKTGYKKDQHGNYIVSKLNTFLLEKLASLTRGKYYLSTVDGREVQSLVEDIRFLKRAGLKEDKIQDYYQVYQFFLGFGLILFLFGYLFYERIFMQKTI